MLKKRNQKGFTLIEIIAVLVILGILAAVAIPKYLNLQLEARDKALAGALAEGLSTAALQYARVTLSKGAAATEAETRDAALANLPGSDDFTYTFTAGTKTVPVTVSWTDSTKNGNSSTKTKNFSLP